MRRLISTLLLPLGLISAHAHPDEGKLIPITTDNTALVLKVAPNGRLYQIYLGEKPDNIDELSLLSWVQKGSPDSNTSPRGWEVCPASGNEDYFEPAISVTHADGNPTTYLYYVDSSTKPVPGGEQTDILLRDDKYPFEVRLHYITYPEDNVIKTWSTITHGEKKAVQLSGYASTMLYLNAPSYYLTEFSGDWGKEAGMSSQKLEFGKKMLDTKLGSRASMHTAPFFEIGAGGPVKENYGEVLTGTLGWTGNFRFIFEVDNFGNLRIIPGINPAASVYGLKPGEEFTTPEFIFTLSHTGASQGSRNLHAWARKHSLKDGGGQRLTLLNNWENTGFNFDQAKLGGLMREAARLGVDMFLLDDGWFGDKYKRNDDRSGLGDWMVNREKLPGGITALVDSASATGVKFGIWIEPEMVNPNSELYRKHPDWAIRLPNREPYYYRNQLVLDLSNPAVQDYVYNSVHGLLAENPGIYYFKWDCNSPITNIYSPYCGENQGRMYIDHVRGLYNVLARLRAVHPDVRMMMCAGGGGRCDYEALKYFSEFWCSDNTDPVERIYIQWGFSHVFPAKAMAAHVTSWNRGTSIKFRTDVASMCRLGFDIGLQELSPEEVEFCRQAVKNWKSLSPAIMDGNQYRLVSPYEGNHAAVSYVDDTRTSAVIFAYDINPRFSEKLSPLKPQGLDRSKNYLVEEINLWPGSQSNAEWHGRVMSGDFLMKAGLDVFTQWHNNSRVIRLTAQ